MTMAGTFCVVSVLVIQLQVVFTNPTCICNNGNHVNPTIQGQSNHQQNHAIANQLRLKDKNVRNIGQNLGQQGGQNNNANFASPPQQQNALQSSNQQLPNQANFIVTNTAPTRSTITLLDPATTDALKSFLKSGVNVDHTVSLPGQTQLPLSSLPASFINKCQNMPEVQSQQRGLLNAQSQLNCKPVQKALTPLQGQISLQSFLNVLSSLNQQLPFAVNENPTPPGSPVSYQQQHLVVNQNAVPAVTTSPVVNNQQNVAANYDAAPTVCNTPVQNQQHNLMPNQNAMPSVFNSPVSNQQPNLMANHNLVAAQLGSQVPNHQQNLAVNQNPVTVAYISPIPKQPQYPVINQNASPTIPPNSPAPNSYAGQSFATISQSQPQPSAPSQPALPVNVLYPQGFQSSQQYVAALPSQPIESPIQTANTNIKKLLPLLFDLVNESECGCRSCNCPCHNNNNNNIRDSNNNYAMQPHVNSGYANQKSYGFTDKSETEEKDNEVFESLGSLRDRLKLWKAKSDSEEKKQTSDSDEADE